MRRQLLLSRFASMRWAIEPSYYATMAAVFKRWASGAHAPGDVMLEVRGDAQAIEARRAAAAGQSGNGIAVLPLYGIVAQRADAVDDISGPGGTSTQRFGRQLNEAVADDSVGSIIIDIDSPGGSVYGVQELADEIYAARAQKPVIAYANSMAASAAYWLGSQATEFHVTPGGDVGSIGVIAEHDDFSKFLENEGIKITYITAGQFKAEGNPTEPLSAEALDFQQSRVDDYYSAFTKAVARGRGVPVGAVRSDMGQGRCYGATQAMDARMVDAVSTFGDVIARARSLMQGGGKSSKSAIQETLERNAQVCAHAQAVSNRIRISQQG
jgi:signal peptide peptidase SppA